jgi:hypothetical protein
MIYNRNKSITEIAFEVTKATVEGDLKKLEELREQLAQLEDDQHGGCRRILKIYLHVKNAAYGSLELTEPEEIEYEYDPENS